MMLIRWHSLSKKKMSGAAEKIANCVLAKRMKQKYIRKVSPKLCCSSHHNQGLCSSSPLRR